MKKRHRKRRAWNLRPWIWGSIQVVFALGIATGTLATISLAGDWSRQFLSEQRLESIHFERIACNTPEDISREHFLQEVQYVASLPDQLDATDIQVNEQLQTAFAAHPRVRHVVSVRVDPIRGTRVELEFDPPIRNPLTARIDATRDHR